MLLAGCFMQRQTTNEPVVSDIVGGLQPGVSTTKDVVARLNGLGYEAHRVLGGIERRPGWREMWDSGSGEQILARSAWFEADRDNLLAFLR